MQKVKEGLASQAAQNHASSQLEAQKIKEHLSSQLADAKYEQLKSQQFLADKLCECCCTIKEKVDSVKEKADTVAFVKASHILIPMSGQLPDGTNIKDSIEAFKKAQEVYCQIKAGGNMAELAGKLSTDQGSARNGGDLGWSNPNIFVPEFANFCKTASAGQVGLVKTQFGFHIIKIKQSHIIQI